MTQLFTRLWRAISHLRMHSCLTPPRFDWLLRVPHSQIIFSPIFKIWPLPNRTLLSLVGITCEHAAIVGGVSCSGCSFTTILWSRFDLYDTSLSCPSYTARHTRVRHLPRLIDLSNSALIATAWGYGSGETVHLADSVWESWKTAMIRMFDCMGDRGLWSFSGFFSCSVSFVTTTQWQ